MPLSAQEAVGIINTFQNMKLAKENASRQAENFGRGLAEHEAGAQPGAAGFDEGMKGRLTGDMGLSPEAANRPFSQTETHQAQKAKVLTLKDTLESQRQAFKMDVEKRKMLAQQQPTPVNIADAKEAEAAYSRFQEIWIDHYLKTQELLPRAGAEVGSTEGALKESGAKSMFPGIDYSTPGGKTKKR